jgi:hypothetical protein
MGCCYPPPHLNLMPMTQGSCAASSETGTLHRQVQPHLLLLAGRSGLAGTDLVLATQAPGAQVCRLGEGRSGCAGPESWR